MHQFWVGSDRLKKSKTSHWSCLSRKLFISISLSSALNLMMGSIRSMCVHSPGWTLPVTDNCTDHTGQPLLPADPQYDSPWSIQLRLKMQDKMRMRNVLHFEKYSNALIYCTVNCKRRTANVMISSECITHDYICSQSLSKVSMTYNQIFYTFTIWRNWSS